MTKPMIGIKTLHKYDKPREKLAAKGVQALKNDELLAVLLGSGIQGKDVRKLSKEIISMLDSDFENLTLDKLCEVHGLGLAKASQILASQEHFLTITLDGASHIINTRTVFIGTLNQSLVHPREVFADAIADRAAGIIIAHNHPSGTLEASRADIQVTERLKEVSKLVGIELLDHVILSKHGYYSFSDEGLL